MKTSELTGLQLDYAVAVAEGMTEYEAPCLFIYRPDWAPTTDWSLMGPIIEREAIAVCTQMTRFDWQAIDFHGDITQFGPTPLIAAARCYVQSKLGDEIEIPEELL